MSTSRGSNIQLDAPDSFLIKSRADTRDKLTRMPSKTTTQQTQRIIRDGSSDRAASGIIKLHQRPSPQRIDSVLKKEVYHADNAATVEVTVKTHKHKAKSTKPMMAPGDLYSWGDILKSQSSNENISSNFTRFDPLRTVHFLAKELQSKVKHLGTDDSGISDVICEMQHALKRVPPEMKNSQQKGPPFVSRLTKVAATQAVHRNILQTTNSQTPNTWYLEPHRLQQHLEESSEKIERACQQMEALCSKLKKEKDELELLLKNERKSTNNLTKQLDEYKLKLNNSESNGEILKSRNEELNKELQKVQMDLKSRNTPSADELKTFIEELQRYKGETEEENMILKQQLQLARMETEKYEAILQARDVQVKEIKHEMTQLQEVVNQQLRDFQNSPYASEEHVRDTDNNTVVNWKDAAVNIAKDADRELYTDRRSGDTSYLSSDDQEKNMSPKLPVKKRHIFKMPNVESGDLKQYREKFDEIKSKALLSCAANPIHAADSRN